MSVMNLVRDNIRALEPYRCARDDFKGTAEVFLDANESWREYVGDAGINRYPDPRSEKLVAKAVEVLGLPEGYVAAGSGSDELIDLLLRIFCRPGKDSILLLPPTYGAYKVFASINDVKIEKVLLKDDFSLDEEAIRAALDRYSPKLLFICSPNNPTGNSMDPEAIRRIAEYNKGLTIVDEAYQDFSDKPSAVSLVSENERVVVLRTLSKAWGLAGARIGLIIASEEIIGLVRNVKYPYNLGLPSQSEGIKALSQAEAVRAEVANTIRERERVAKLLSASYEVIPSDANFLLVRIPEAEKVYDTLKQMGIITRLRSHEPKCKDGIRITIGSREENDRLLAALEVAGGR